MESRGQAEDRRELAAARSEIQRLRKQLQAARAQLQAAQGRIAWLESRLETLLRTLFGRKSEKPDEPPGKEDGADGDGKPADEEQSGKQGGESADEEQDGKQEEERPRKPRKQRGRKPGTPAPQRVDRSKVPVKVELLDVPEAERKCRYCGKAYVRSGCKTSWIHELEWQAVARLIRRLIYRPACACEEARTLTAPPAPRLGERTQLGTTVWALGIVQVFALFRPQAAVARDLTALGLPLPVSTLSQGLRRLAALFEPLDAAIRERQAQAAVAQADETSWPVQYIEGQANGKQPPASGGKPLHWLWVCLTADTVRMRILPTRSAKAARELLGSLGRGLHTGVIVVCDRWSAYKALARLLGDRILLQFCWSHQRRDILRAATGFPSLQGWRDAWIERIGELFHLAKLRRQAWRPDLPLDGQDARYRACHARLEACLHGIFETVRKELHELCAAGILEYNCPSRDGRVQARLAAQAKALLSLQRHREGLSVFLRDPRVPLDNNASERVLRGPVIARYTCFGSGGPDGARVAGLMFGVFATLRLAGLNPYTWVLDYLDACAVNRGRPPERLDPWLPWLMDEDRKRELRGPPVRQHGGDRPASQAADRESRPALPQAA